MPDLTRKRIAILATDGFEQSELISPLEALEEAGAEVDIISLEDGNITGWNENDWADDVPVDLAVAEADVEDYDGLVLPGGVINPDKLRKDPAAVAFVASFFQAGKPVAAICHGPWTLVEANVVRGRRLTSYESIRTDLKNAGARWVDEPVVEDDGLITSRNPGDLEAFNAKAIHVFAQTGQQHHKHGAKAA